MRFYFFFNLSDYFFFLPGAGALAEATAAERSAPALNLATVLASMLIGFLVAGLIPCLAALSATEKVPNPTKETFPSFFFKVVVTLEINDSKAALAATLVMPASLAIASIN